jgi:arylsulfatase A-like enzyme
MRNRSKRVARRWQLALTGLLLAFLAGCTQQGTGPPSILLVTLDTTRADRIGAYGRDGARTPTLDRLARQGILFERAIAPTPITLPSHASILTGVYPTAHGVRDNAVFVLAPEARLVSEVLAERGWRTAAFVGSLVLHPHFGLDQGFEVYHAPQPTREPMRDLYVERPANEVVDDARAWLSGLAAGERFFVWLHFFDPHMPYEPPPAWRKPSLHPYEGETAFCDAQLGRLLEALEEVGRARNLLVAVTADHGESLGEHGEETHGVFIYQATLHVPLILSGEPVARARGQRVGHAVSTVDLPATLLALAGIPIDELPDAHAPTLVARDGSLRRLDAERAIYTESLLPYHSFRWHALRGLVWRDHELIEGRRRELYALDEDSGGQRDRAGEAPELLERMRETLRNLSQRHGPLGWSESRGVTADEGDLLRALGYTVGSIGGDPFDPALPDPHDRIGDIRLISVAERRIERAARLRPIAPERFAAQDPKQLAIGLRALGRARETLLELRENNPEDPHVFVDLGTVESRLGNHSSAVPLLERAIQLYPSVAALRHHLAVSYHATGHAEAARREMRKARSLDPGESLYDSWLREHGP